MTTKEKLLALFEENKGVYLSGEQIAERLALSRNAVWKAVRALRSEGYQIDAVPNRGYSLSVETDILSGQGVAKYLNEAGRSLNVTVLPTVASTNGALRQQAAAGAPEGTVIAANTQTAGRGRFGRSFFSPADTGVYLSLLLRPAVQAVKVTTMAAVAACQALEALCPEGEPRIKWVNDVYMRGRKVCGILTEASLSLETGSLDYLVLGLGVNLYPPKGDFPPELQSIAGAVFDKPQRDGKNRLAAEFLNRFMAYYEQFPRADYAAAYREKSLVIGRPIQVLAADGARNATALDVDGDCRLIVRYEDGSTDRLDSGEISIRL